MKGLNVMIANAVDNSISSNNLRGGATFLCLVAAALLLTSCPGNGGASGTFDDGSGETYAGSASSISSRSGSSSTITISFEDIMNFSNSGDTDALVGLFADGSGGAGTEVVAISAADIGLPAGGTITLVITGGGQNYEKTAVAAADGMVYFLVPWQVIGTTVTVSLVMKKADGTVICSGEKTMFVSEGCSFSIELTDAEPEGFVRVGGLYVCIHEVTQGEYETYCSYGGSLTPSSSGKGAGPDFPAYYVSWYDALVYCNLRSMAEGFTPCYTIGGSTDPTDWGSIPTSDNSTWSAVTCNSSANGYRLPTRAEWEQTADDGHLYSGSDTIDDVAWYRDNSGDGGGSTNRKSHPVKTKAPNANGIYDMTGNVAELCWKDGSISRATYGGCWDVAASLCVVSSPNHKYPSERSYAIGFRVVRNAN